MNNTVFKIVKAERQNMPVRIALWGPTGSGKTYSAVLLAHGLTEKGKKICVIDTENHRSTQYSGIIGEDWYHIDLQPPYTPERYTAAVQSVVKAGGFGCIIIDSASHIWMGKGGILEQAEASPQKGQGKWKAPKNTYNKTVDTIFHSPVPIIFCLRAREKNETSGDNKLKSIGYEPIIEKSFLHEMTVSIMLNDQHCPVMVGDQRFRATPLTPPVKAPEDLFNKLFQDNGPIGERHGKIISEWLKAAKSRDLEQDDIERQARDAASIGRSNLRRFYKEQLAEGRTRLEAIQDELNAIADEADERAMIEQAALDDELGFDESNIL